MSNSPEFSRVISVRSFLKPRVLPATLLAIVSGGLLFGFIFLVGGIGWLLVESARPTEPAADNGLLPLADRLQSEFGGPLVSQVIRSLSPFQSSRSAAIVMICLAAALAALRLGTRYLSRLILERHVADSVLRLRQHIHRKAIRLEPADLTGEQTRIADRLFQNAASALENAAIRWGDLWLSALPDVVAVLIVAFSTNWRLAIQTIIPVIIGRLTLRAEARRTDASLRLLSEQVDRGLGRMSESLRKTRIVTSFGMEQTEHQQFESHLEDYSNRCRLMKRQQSLGGGIRNAILIVMVVVPSVILALHVLNGSHPAVMLIMGFCLAVVFRGTHQLEARTELVALGGEKADEIAAYINRIPGVSQAPGAGFLEPMSRTLTFNQISYQTPQLPGLLRGLDLRVSFGERVALLSLQPAAANAVASMIPRFLDPDLGQVLIDGRDIRQATLESLRAEALLVGGQDPVFNATVLENITCGQADISRQQALDAAKLVHADHFIRNLPRGYETVLGEHGVALDAGQAFRLSLARAVVRSPALLVIEEPQVVLDSETKTMLDDAYQRLCTNRTVIFLPYRLSTVKKCSRIVLIHEGRVAADGVHDQLVRSSELYRHWEYVRFNPFRDEAE